MSRYPHVFIAVALAASVFIAAAAKARGRAERPRPPNVVVILAGDLGYGDLGCFGQKTLKTPALDAMAAEGMRFTQFYAGGATDASSLCVLLTGRHGGRLTVRGSATRPAALLTPGQPTVSSLLKGAGYATAFVGRWSLGNRPDDSASVKAAGFDQLHGTKDVRERKLTGAEGGVATGRAGDVPGLPVDDAMRFVREHRASPFFLLLTPAPPRWDDGAAARAPAGADLGEFAGRDWPDAEKRYEARVRRLDHDVGRLLTLLKQLGIDQHTLVILTADNGPRAELGHDAEFFDSNGKHRGGTGDLNEGGIRVPTIAWWPGTVPPGGENDRQWYAGDLMATAAELAGVERPDRLDGDSLVPALRGRVNPDQWARRGRLYWERHEGQTAQAVRFGKWKAIRSPMFTGPVELYDMSNDPAEKRDYAKRRPDLTRHATNLLNASREPDPSPDAAGGGKAPPKHDGT